MVSGIFISVRSWIHGRCCCRIARLSVTLPLPYVRDTQKPFHGLTLTLFPCSMQYALLPFDAQHHSTAVGFLSRLSFQSIPVPLYEITWLDIHRAAAQYFPFIATLLYACESCAARTKYPGVDALASRFAGGSVECHGRNWGWSTGVPSLQAMLATRP